MVARRLSASFHSSASGASSGSSTLVEMSVPSGTAPPSLANDQLRFPPDHSPGDIEHRDARVNRRTVATASARAQHWMETGRGSNVTT
jgi:hypothetical protein